MRTLYIEPGAPWQNAYTEPFIGRFLRDELLKNREGFANVEEAKEDLAEDYREHYTITTGR